MADLKPYALRDAPSLIETVFPAQKVSFEAQKERKANLGQTLTGLGSYWKGRKPLILVRAIVLGILLPQTDDAEKDLEIFELLMGFDEESLARRAVIQNKLKPKEIAAIITLDSPWDYFSYAMRTRRSTPKDFNTHSFPLDSDAEGITLKWRRDVGDAEKLNVYRQTLSCLGSYEQKAALCKRPEEVDPDWLYEHVWLKVNNQYSHLGINVGSHQELSEQLGVLRYGHRPKVGDTFAGGGSIPFEAARLGCDVYASDLNPIASMLTWGALNIVGASSEQRVEIERVQRDVSASVDRKITELGIEHDEQGSRAKAYLYCLETRCPETGWVVPLSPSWVISKTRNVIARLIPDAGHKRFDIEVISGASASDMKEAAQGTVVGGALSYELDGSTYHTPIKTLRGDYRNADGQTSNRLRRWCKTDFQPAPKDVFQERLYCIQWITKESIGQKRIKTFFSAVTESDLERERKVAEILEQNLEGWQAEGLLPDMEIEPGHKTNEPIRTRGWTHWHHLFNPRQLLTHVLFQKESVTPASRLLTAKGLDYCSRLCRWDAGHAGSSPQAMGTFTNQALNTLYNYGVKSAAHLCTLVRVPNSSSPLNTSGIVSTSLASCPGSSADLWVTDPPYADAVHYHEITEFFIAWLRSNPPTPFDEWTWDSRRAVAIKGSGDEFRRGMVAAYSAMTAHMPENGMQCVMFTHQDTGVWSDMVGIFWAAGLQVVAAWYIATETTSELKKGGYVQGTVILMLKKREAGDRPGFKQRILPAVRNEVQRQIETMMHLNEKVERRLGEPVFTDSDLQMAGYAAALKVLTAFTQVGGEDVTSFSLRPRRRGEVTVVDEIVQQAAEAANSLLVPEGLAAETWQRISGIQRFYLRMVDMETTGASKLDNYQNFAKAFRVVDYSKVMGSMTANKARLKRVSEFSSRDLTDSTEIGATWLGRLIIGLQQLLADTEPQVVVSQLQAELPDFMDVRRLLIDMLQFLHSKAPESEVRAVAETLANRLQNLRALSQ